MKLNALKPEIFLAATAVASALLLAACRAADAPNSALTDGSGSFATGRYRNLFAENGHPEKEIRARIDSTFAQHDAFRTAGNWSVDWSWWRTDPREAELSDKLQAFFESKGMGTYGCRFTLEGRKLENRHAQELVAVNAVAGLAATNPRAKKFVEALWNTPAPDGRQRCYEGLLYMMSLLHCRGEFKIWSPR